MDSWFVWALLATVVWSGLNLIDKIMVGRYHLRPSLYMVIGGMTSLIPALFIFLFWEIKPLPLGDRLSAMASGAMIVGCYYSYFKALQIADAPIISTLWQLCTVFIFILSYFFLGEVFTLQTYIGMFLVVFGSIAISFEKPKKGEKKLKKSNMSPALKLMAVACILCASGIVLQKSLMNPAGFVDVFFYAKIGDVLFAVSFLFLGRVRRSLKELLHAPTRNKILSINMSAELVNGIATLALLKALETGPASLVSALVSSQVMLTLFMLLLLNWLKKGLIPDAASHQDLRWKLPIMGAVVLGIGLIG